MLPILESFVGAICTRIEQYKAKCGVKIAEYNSQITQINMGEEVGATHPIGFQFTPEEGEEIYED